MKPDEIKFFIAMVGYGRILGTRNDGIPTRCIMGILSNYIPWKRMDYYLEKWTGLGFYNYGVSLETGWLELDNLPERYKELLK